MTITILDKTNRTIRVEATKTDEGFDWTRDRGQILLDNGHLAALATVTRWEESLDSQFTVEAWLSKQEFVALKELIGQS